MEYRVLGRTDLRVSVLGFGCGNVGGLMVRGTRAERERAVARALELGVDHQLGTQRAVAELRLGQIEIILRLQDMVRKLIPLHESDPTRLAVAADQVHASDLRLLSAVVAMRRDAQGFVDGAQYRAHALVKPFRRGAHVSGRWAAACEPQIVHLHAVGGIGVPAEVVTWGSILNEARSNSFAWWLAVFPGAAIFLAVVAYYLVGEGLRDALDPRLQ